MNFLQQKKNQLEKIDKSHEQKWDDKIKGLCEKINKNPKYYTTSSCAGRVTITKAEKNKSEDAFLFKSHKKINLKQIEKLNYKKLAYFKQEPCILHVACIDLESARKILDLAQKTGWKRSGITSSGERIVLELISTEKLELPIANHGKILVSKDYLKLLVKESNIKLEKTWQKIKNLEKLI